MCRLRCFLLFFSLLLLPDATWAQSYCGRTSGIYAREFSYYKSEKLRNLARAAAEGKDFLIISALNPKEMMVSDQRILDISKRAFGSSPGLEEARKSYAIELEKTEQSLVSTGLSMSRAKVMASQALLDHLFSKPPVSDDMDFIHVYSSNPTPIVRAAPVAASEAGVIIESKFDDTHKIFDNTNSPSHPIKKIIDYLDLGAVILLDVKMNSDIYKAVPPGVPVIKINDRASIDYSRLPSRVHAARRATSAQEENVSIMNMLPGKASDTKPWRFNEGKTAAYIDAGAAFDRGLSKRGYKDIISKHREKKVFIQRLSDEVAKGKTVYIIGEADERGQIRIPGSDEVLTKADFSGIDLSKIFFISCNSNAIAGNDAALSLLGRIYTTNAEGVLEFLLPGEKGKADARIEIVSEGFNALLMELLAELACAAALGDDCPIALLASFND